MIWCKADFFICWPFQVEEEEIKSEDDDEKKKKKEEKKEKKKKKEKEEKKKEKEKKKKEDENKENEENEENVAVEEVKEETKEETKEEVKKEKKEKKDKKDKKEKKEKKDEGKEKKKEKKEKKDKDKKEKKVKKDKEEKSLKRPASDDSISVWGLESDNTHVHLASHLKELLCFSSSPTRMKRQPSVSNTECLLRTLETTTRPSCLLMMVRVLGFRLTYINCLCIMIMMLWFSSGSLSKFSFHHLFDYRVLLSAVILRLIIQVSSLPSRTLSATSRVRGVHVLLHSLNPSQHQILI